MLLTVVVCGALWLMYPRQTLEQRLLDSGQSVLADDYLRNLLRSDPNNPTLRLLTARRELTHGDTERARITLQPALESPDPRLRDQALWTQGEILYQDWVDAHGDVDRSETLKAQLQRQVRVLAQITWPPEQSRLLASFADQFGLPDVAMKLVREGAPKEPAQAAGYYEHAAKDALAQGDYVGCAQFYLAARESTADPAEARRYYFAAVAALRSSNKVEEALQFAEREIGPLANDQQTLIMLTDLARAAGHPEIADKYVRRLLKVGHADHLQPTPPARGAAIHPAAWRVEREPKAQDQGYDDGASLLAPPEWKFLRRVADQTAAPSPAMLPFDDKIYSLAYDVFLANKELQDAWALADSAVRQQPDNMAWRARLARVSEWTQRPVLALQNWLIVAQTTHQEDAWQNVLRLAPGQFEDQAVARMLDDLQQDPSQGPWARLLLLRRRIARGDLAEARAALQPLLASADVALHQEALWTQGQLDFQELQRWPRSKSEQAGAQRALFAKNLQESVRQLADQSWPAERQIELAIMASKAGAPDLAMNLVQKNAPTAPAEAAAYYERAAQEALAQGDYEGCARLYLAARKSTTDPAEAKRYYFAAVAALRSGNETKQALELAEHEIGPLANDRQTLLMITELARAAGRPDVANKYVRLLLKVGLARQLQASPLAVDSGFESTVGHAEPAAVAPQREFDDGASLLAQPGHGYLLQVADRTQTINPAGLPFDDKTYSLAYQVFLEARNLQDAWAIADSAVKQRPGDMTWRERLAQVSEWTQRPVVALQSWLVVAQATHREDAWQNVLRLAPGLFDDKAVVQALRHELTRRPDDPELIRRFVAAQERIGQPQAALDYLRPRAHSPAMLELLAGLAERAGQNQLALDTWRKLFADPAQVTPERALHAAVLALSLGESRLGLQWLITAQNQKPAAPAAPATNDELLRLTGQVAASRKEDRLAVDAYRKLVAADKAQAEDYDALFQLLRRRQPAEAARVELLAWQRFGNPRAYMDALSLLFVSNEWTEFARAVKLLDDPSAAARDSAAEIRRSAQFLRLVGDYEDRIGNVEAARAAYVRAIEADPHSTDAQQGLLWLLINSGDTESVRQLLAQHETEWSQSSGMHDVLAAAYQSLSLYHVALERYLTPHLAAHGNDFLWLMNYADALDQDHQTGRAWTLRRELLRRQWQRLRQSQGGKELSDDQVQREWLHAKGLGDAERVARVRLVVAQRSGDPANAVLRELLRLDRNADRKLSDAAAEVAISWLQERQNYSAERGFLWQQYARSRSAAANRPLWAEIGVALAENDKAAAGQILERSGARISAADRAAAADAVGDTRLAQSTLFDNQLDQPDDDLHQQLTDDLLAFSDRAGVNAAHLNLSGINENQLGLGLHLPINPRWSLDFELDRIIRSVTDRALFSSVPNENIAKATLNWRHPDGDTKFQIANRRGYSTTTPLLLQHEQRLTSKLFLRGELGWHLPTDETLPLRVGGMKDRLAARLRYQFTPRDQLMVTQAGERYRLQTGVEVGTGRHTALEYTHAIWQGAPSLEVGAFWSTHHYSRRDPAFFGAQGAIFQQRLVPAGTNFDAGYLLPTTFQFYGITLSTNMQYAQDHTRPVRPYASVSRTWHSQLGPGYDLTVGLAGSVLGGDRLSLGWGISKSGVQSLGFVRTLQLSYQLNF